ncbi:hypothetical protein [Niallia sp. Man26]|uniref:hypothetical protein n=1 Tax=unclassified Niallia TaxID=2837522 RepID=UPI000FD3023F|nr:hypothetical protein [Niallia sp. Man26]RUU72683.1 hypothetical protein EOC06_37615 [Mesorhizobium sp. M7A.F.Ca.MR.362.00.0.0]UPO91380.1 hypothetical protein L8T27_028545 [Niallia sp. Man26]
MSKVNDIKNLKRLQKQITPSQALAEEIIEEKTFEQEKKLIRKRVSFDLRTDLHRELKMQSLLQEKNIYILIEEALEKYLNKIKE